MHRGGVAEVKQSLLFFSFSFSPLSFLLFFSLLRVKVHMSNDQITFRAVVIHLDVCGTWSMYLDVGGGGKWNHLWFVFLFFSPLPPKAAAYG